MLQDKAQLLLPLLPVQLLVLHLLLPLLQALQGHLPPLLLQVLQEGVHQLLLPQHHQETGEHLLPLQLLLPQVIIGLNPCVQSLTGADH